MIIYVSIYKLSTTGGEEMLLSSLLMSKGYHLISSLGLYIIKVFPKYLKYTQEISEKYTWNCLGYQALEVRQGNHFTI